jgi:hypothetical protein
VRFPNPAREVREGASWTWWPPTPPPTPSPCSPTGRCDLPASRNYAAGLASYALAIRDLNGDGKPDLATANESASSVSVLVSRGDRTFQAKRDYPAGEYAQSVATGDLNRDGKSDLVTDSDAVTKLGRRRDLCPPQRDRPLRGALGKGEGAAGGEAGDCSADCRVGKTRSGYSKTVKRGA